MSKIVHVEIGRLDYPLVGEFKFFRTGARPSVLLRLTDDEGVTGCGQAVPVETWTYETPESVETTLRHHLAGVLIGADPSNLPEVHERMERAIRPSFSIGQPLCKAAVDLACHDLWGRRVNKPVAELLGGARKTEVKLSWTVNAASLEKAEQVIAQGKAMGYDSFNIKLGAPQSPAYDLELVQLVRRLAPQGFHWGDANTSYDIETALAQAPRLADLGLQALESPLPPNRIRDYQRLRRQGALPILMDEGIVSPVEVEEFIALGMFDGIAMKVARCGGLWNAARIVRLLQENDLKLFASGLTDPDLSLAASIHLFAWAGLDCPAALNGPQYLASGGTGDPQFRAERDRMRLPAGPGLGIAPGEALARSFATAARA